MVPALESCWARKATRTVYRTELCYTVSTASTAQCRMQKQVGTDCMIDMGCRWLSITNHSLNSGLFHTNTTYSQTGQCSLVVPLTGEGEGGVLISKLSFFVLFLSVSLLIAETARSCDIIFCFFPSFFASQCYSNNCLATFPLEQSHFGQGATVGKMGLVSGGSRSEEK